MSTRVAGVLVLMAGLAIGSASVLAADSQWTGDVDALWSTTTNWNPGLPTASDTALFDSAGNGNTAIDLGGGATVAAVRFADATAAAYTLGSAGQSLTLASAGEVIR
ncbi:MAG: hypothetical protein NZ658_07285, partial [Pirellulales bacterium]|nr:hypothetical protein [Pirellulales bacterium]